MKIPSVHTKYVHSRRVGRLCQHFCEIIPMNTSVLDVGCGDGILAASIKSARPDIEIRGIDVLERPDVGFPIEIFDGEKMPFSDKSVDIVMFVDVLHHTLDPNVLLSEAVRVGKHFIVIKDHLLEGYLAHETLRFMDYVGNAKHGVALPYNYWPREKWLATFAYLGLTIETWIDDLDLYHPLANLFFGRRLHFVARLAIP